MEVSTEVRSTEKALRAGVDKDAEARILQGSVHVQAKWLRSSAE